MTTEYVKNMPPDNESPEDFKRVQGMIENLAENPLRELAEHHGMTREEIEKMVPGEIKDKILATIAGKDSSFYKELEEQIIKLKEKYN